MIPKMVQRIIWWLLECVARLYGWKRLGTHEGRLVNGTSSRQESSWKQLWLALSNRRGQVVTFRVPREVAEHGYVVGFTRARDTRRNNGSWFQGRTRHARKGRLMIPNEPCYIFVLEDPGPGLNQAESDFHTTRPARLIIPTLIAIEGAAA